MNKLFKLGLSLLLVIGFVNAQSGWIAGNTDAKVTEDEAIAVSVLADAIDGISSAEADILMDLAEGGDIIVEDLETDDVDVYGSVTLHDGLTTTGAVFTLSTLEPSVDDGDVLGQIDFQAPLETGADAILVPASIWAEADASFTASVNTTSLVFGTATSAVAAETMRLSSVGDLTITGGDLTGANGNAIDIGEAVDGTITFSRDDTGAIILTTADDDANADLTVVPGGSGNLLLGDAGGTVEIASSDWTVDATGNMANIGTIGLDGTITQARTTTANGYTSDISTEWTAGAAMAAGGSNGIYAICNPIVDVQNAYGLRARMDLRDAAADVDVNQLHAIDALINLNDTATIDYTVDDNVSVVGMAIHGGVTNALMDGTGTGSLGGATLNLLFGMWGPTAEQDYALETNFAKFISHAGTTVDYGLNIESSSDMDAGILLNSHSSNSPATMDVGVEMITAADKMVYGVDMSQAGITTADVRLSDSSLMFGDVTNGAILATATGVTNVNYVGALNRTVITLTNYVMTMTDAAAAGSHGTLKLIDFPDGMIRATSVVGDLEVTAISGGVATTAVFDVALGSATTLTNAETLGNANVDFVAKVDGDLIGSVDTIDLLNYTSQDEDGHTSSTDVWLCVAIENASSSASGTMTWSGTIVITWHNMGDY